MIIGGYHTLREIEGEGVYIPSEPSEAVVVLTGQGTMKLSPKVPEMLFLPRPRLDQNPKDHQV